MNLSTVQQNAAIAIIFYKGTDLNNTGETASRTLGVGLINETSGGYYFCKNSSDGYSHKFTSTIYNEIEGTGVKNGSANFSNMCTELGVATLPKGSSPYDYSAMYYGYEYKTKASGLSLSSNTIESYQTGWYLPSAIELYYICSECKKSGDSLNDKITACRTNATAFDMTKKYVSSSQHKDTAASALAVNFSTFGFEELTKNYTACACAIHEF